MFYCYLCEEELTEQNSSIEHIILNSIGGKLKSRRLLCKTCNSNFGSDADGELSKQLYRIASFLQVKRDHGKNQTIKGGKTVSGKEYHIIDGRKPTLSAPEVKKIVQGDSTTFSVSARDEKELVNILRGLKKKYPEIDLETAKKHFQWKEEYLDEFIRFTERIGGDLAFKSIAKTAINFYICNRQETEQVKHLFPYLKSDKDINIVNHFHPKPIYKKTKGEVVHLLYLYGNKYNNLLFCYVEFFSVYSFVVLLSDEYTGKNFSITYCYDLLKNKEIKKDVKLKFKNEEIYEHLKIEINNHYEIITKKMTRLLGIIQSIQTKHEISKISQKAIDTVFNKYKHEKFITEEMINELSKELAIKYVNFAYRGKINKID